MSVLLARVIVNILVNYWPARAAVKRLVQDGYFAPGGTSFITKDVGVSVGPNGPGHLVLHRREAAQEGDDRLDVLRRQVAKAWYGMIGASMRPSGRAPSGWRRRPARRSSCRARSPCPASGSGRGTRRGRATRSRHRSRRDSAPCRACRGSSRACGSRGSSRWSRDTCRARPRPDRRRDEADGQRIWAGTAAAAATTIFW